MRSPIGPILVLLGLGTTVVLVLVLLQVNGLRSDLENARSEIGALQARVDGQASSLTVEELRRELDDLEASLDESLIGADGGAGGDPTQPAGGGTAAELLERMDEVLDRIAALDERVSDICDGVPVC